MKAKIGIKLSFFLLLASLLPLLFFGVLAITQVRKATMTSVREGHSNISRRAAEQIQQYVQNALTIIEANAESMSRADLKSWQEERILENYINRFKEFNELSILDKTSKVIATTYLENHQLSSYEREAIAKGLEGQLYLSPVFIKKDLCPAMIAAFPIKKLSQITSVLVGEINLMHMWYLVDHIKIGETGILNVVGGDGRLIATGSGARKKEVFLQSSFEPKSQWKNIFRTEGALYKTPDGQDVLAVGFSITEPLSWSVIVEQPISEAYALTHRITILLIGVMIVFILLALGLGFYVGRKEVVSPIQILLKATDELARGHLDYRISLPTGDEFEVLGEAFNQMTLRLKDLQRKLLVEERHALFGRIASGLAHDLKHPVQAIETSSKLMEKMYDDEEFRKTFRRTVEREFKKINQFLSDLHNLVHEVSIHPVPLKVNQLVEEAVATFESDALQRDMSIELTLADSDPTMDGDPISLNRALSNLISNALQAMPRHGKLKLSITQASNSLEISVKDTGKGISPERINTLFDDFVTTKPRGLGLGLAITRKIIQSHGGKILVQSELGKGTEFKIIFPYRDKKLSPS